MNYEQSQSKSPIGPQTWAELDWKLQLTLDGSPTLKKISDDGLSEWMHHSGGAWSETRLIYGQIIEEAFRCVKKPSLLSVGLGLGYNEILTGLYAVLTNQDFNLLSFEIAPELVEMFLRTFDKKNTDCEIAQTYDLIFDFIRSDFPTITKDSLLKKMQVALTNKSWKLESDFLIPQEYQKSNVILYDAFSSRTNGELWSEEFLEKMLSEFAAQDCLFSSYACTGNLKRALIHQGFQVEVREGFLGKRNSTRARRGIFCNKT